MNLYFHSVKSFLAMGGYASFVWSAYAVVLLALFLFSFRRRSPGKRSAPGE